MSLDASWITLLEKLQWQVTLDLKMIIAVSCSSVLFYATPTLVWALTTLILLFFHPTMKSLFFKAALLLFSGRIESDTALISVAPPSDFVKNILQLITCPITKQLMHDPVVASDGYTYERHYIQQRIQGNGVSPQTGMPLQKELIRNRIMQTISHLVMREISTSSIYQDDFVKCCQSFMKGVMVTIHSKRKPQRYSLSVVIPTIMPQFPKMYQIGRNISIPSLIWCTVERDEPVLKGKVDLRQVGAVVKGKFTKILLSKSLRTVNESLCLSLLTKEDTIDIEFTNENIRDAWYFFLDWMLHIVNHPCLYRVHSTSHDESHSTMQNFPQVQISNEVLGPIVGLNDRQITESTQSMATSSHQSHSENER